MRWNLMRGGRVWLWVSVLVSALFVVAASVMLPRYVSEFGIVIVPAAFLACLALGVLFVVPVETLPAVALVLYVLIPPRMLPSDGPLAALPLMTIVLGIWGFRRLVLRQGERMAPGDIPRRGEPFKALALLFGALFFVWGALSLFRSPDLQTSLGWLISFTAGALLPLLIGRARREAALIQRAWLFMAGVMGAYAIVEAVFRTNPVWGTLYSIMGVQDEQPWSVYRSEASFGHPLFAALFFAVACALGLGAWLTSRSRWALTALILSGLGLVCTVSRGAMLAAAVAMAFVYIAALLMRGEKLWGRFAFAGAMAGLAVIGLFQFDAFSARNDSAEAQLSSLARELAWSVSMKSGELTDWLGSGTGTSGITGRRFNEVVIENSLLQLLIGVGIPGLLLFALTLTAAFFHALDRRAPGAAAGLLAYAISISAFNALDGVRPMHLLLGCLLILTLNPPEPAEPELPVAQPVGAERGQRTAGLRSPSRHSPHSPHSRNEGALRAR
jgi:hypothetical protein